MDATSSVTPSSTSHPVHIVRGWRMEDAESAAQVPDAEGLDFDDFLDLVNPLQHIPIIGSIYRALTGDEIKPEVQIAGGFLYGLATGTVLLSGASSIATAIYENAEGEEPTVQIAHALFDSNTVQPPAEEAGTVQLAGAAPVSPPLPKVAEAAPAAEKTAVAPAESTKVKTAQQAEKQPKTANIDSQTLGLMFQEQAQTYQAGQALPPELVHDMMLMALDKYKAAQATIGTETAFP